MSEENKGRVLIFINVNVKNLNTDEIIQSPTQREKKTKARSCHFSFFKLKTIQ